jgi:hypothetical protein
MECHRHGVEGEEAQGREGRDEVREGGEGVAVEVQLLEQRERAELVG